MQTSKNRNCVPPRLEHPLNLIEWSIFVHRPIFNPSINRDKKIFSCFYLRYSSTMLVSVYLWDCVCVCVCVHLLYVHVRKGEQSASVAILIYNRYNYSGGITLCSRTRFELLYIINLLSERRKETFNLIHDSAIVPSGWHQLNKDSDTCQGCCKLHLVNASCRSGIDDGDDATLHKPC